MALPPATLRVLKALDAQPFKRLAPHEICAAAHIKHRALFPLLGRMERERYIARDYVNGLVDLTFGGMRALETEGSELRAVD